MLMAATTPQDDGFPTLGDALDPRKAAAAMTRDLQAAGHDCKDLTVEARAQGLDRLSLDRPRRCGSNF
jgi:hypothetical protein